jgi:hypothetical protein
MDERAGIEQGVPAARTQSGAGQPAQVGVGRGIERVGSDVITALGAMDQLGQTGAGFFGASHDN